MVDVVGIIGLGNAGGAVAGALAAKIPVVGFDLDEGRRAVAAGLTL